MPAQAHLQLKRSVSFCAVFDGVARLPVQVCVCSKALRSFTEYSVYSVIAKLLLPSFYQPGALHSLGWSYSYFAIFVSVCLSVRARSGKAWECVAAGMYGCFKLVCSPPHCKRKPSDACTIDSRGTEMPRNRRLTMNKPRPETAIIIQHSLSELHDPVSL